MLPPVHTLTSPSPLAGGLSVVIGLPNPSASSAGPDLLSDAEARWADVTVQQCLDLCSNVELIYRLLIQEVQPVLGG